MDPNSNRRKEATRVAFRPRGETAGFDDIAGTPPARRGERLRRDRS
jgi:hypothetical protein